MSLLISSCGSVEPRRRPEWLIKNELFLIVKKQQLCVYCEIINIFFLFLIVMTSSMSDAIGLERLSATAENTLLSALPTVPFSSLMWPLIPWKRSSKSTGEFDYTYTWF